MRDNKIIELIQKSLDGTITPSEGKALNRVLSQDPEMQETLLHLQQVSGMMDKMSQVEPPKDLLKRIMNRIDLKRYSPKDVTTARTALIKGIFSKFEPKLAIAFGFGVVAVLLAFILIQDHGMDMPENNWQDYYGTIGTSENLNFKSKEKIPIDVHSIQGSIDFQKTETLLGLEIALKAKQDFQLQIEYDPKTLRWNGLKPLNGLNLGLDTGVDFITLAHETDMHVFLFFLQTGKTESQLELKLWQSEEMVWQGRISNPVPGDE